ncbi:hypothetical protein Q3G72_015640 [Acer saccharum]|nr:hypothetical protein Q3G72_015640 [Acer saccharum]
MRREKVAKWPEVSNAWNFDFDDDDDESDGANVASFEYDDSPSRGEDAVMVIQGISGDLNTKDPDLGKYGGNDVVGSCLTALPRLSGAGQNITSAISLVL